MKIGEALVVAYSGHIGSSICADYLTVLKKSPLLQIWQRDE
jgi:hypothetical protein